MFLDFNSSLAIDGSTNGDDFLISQEGNKVKIPKKTIMTKTLFKLIRIFFVYNKFIALGLHSQGVKKKLYKE